MAKIFFKKLEIHEKQKIRGGGSILSGTFNDDKPDDDPECQGRPDPDPDPDQEMKSDFKCS